MTRIQDLVDELAQRLQRSVAVDTPDSHLIASSRHFGDEDAPRIGVVLNRDLDERVAKYLFSFRIRSAQEKVLIPAQPELRLKARCCYPLYRRKVLVGFLWLIDGDGPDEVVAPYVEQIAAAVGDESEATNVGAHRLSQLGRKLLSSDGDVGQAARAVREHGFASDGSVVRLIATARSDRRHDTVSPTESASVLAAVREWRRPGREALELELGGTTVLICAFGADEDEDGISRLASRISAELANVDSRIGVSELGTLEESRVLLRQALLSAYAGHIFAGLPAALAWADLFPERVVLEMAASVPASAEPPESMSALFEPGNSGLLETVETFLDHGGDRTVTSEALFIHRSTLNYRLTQVQKLIGEDPTDGRSRLGLHLAIKLRRALDGGIAKFLQIDENLG
jgi:hypothetical protein